MPTANGRTRQSTKGSPRLSTPVPVSYWPYPSGLTQPVSKTLEAIPNINKCLFMNSFISLNISLKSDF